MSYQMYNVRCDDCHHTWVTAFGIVGTTQIAEPTTKCPQCQRANIHKVSDFDWGTGLQSVINQQKTTIPDPTNPSHYKNLRPEPFEVIEGWNLNYNIGSALKYLSRYRAKGAPAQDLRKALCFIQREIDNLEKQQVASVTLP